MSKIIIVGGGTGGHLFPAISVAEEMLKRNHDVHLVTDSRCKSYLKNFGYIKTHIIDSSGFKSTPWDMVRGAVQIILAVFKTLILFIRIKPDFVVGFGGYVPFPSLLCARLLRIPFAIHEQNAFLGKVNKWFAPFAKYIFLTSKDTPNIPPQCELSRRIISGNPVRAEIKNAVPQKRDFASEPFVILVLGGSQGAKVFSELVPAAVELMVQSHPGLKIKVIQQAKTEDISEIQAWYNKYHIQNEVSEFFYNIPELMISSHIVIARSGASTMAELIALSQPALLIPYPFAAEKHQHFNAKVFAESGGGWWLDQEECRPDLLASKLLELIQNREILKAASLSLKSLATDSANIIANTLEK